MGCIIEKYPNTKLWEKLLEIEADVLNIGHERLSCTQNSPSLAGTGETIRFSVSIIDNVSGPIPEDRIVAGTYDLIRIRNNIETTIVDDGAFSKRDGFVYIDIDFDSATWDLDDSYILIPNQNSTAEIDGTIYHLPLSAWSGMILDLSSLETAVNTIISTIGTPAGASLAVDIADIEAKLDNGTYGLAALNTDLDALLADVGDASGSGLGSLYGILGDPAQTFTAMIGYEGATSLANKLTAARAGYVDNINNANLATMPDISTLSAARIGYMDELAAANLPTDVQNVYNDTTAVLADVGDASASSLGSLYAIIGDPAVTISALLDMAMRPSLNLYEGWQDETGIDTTVWTASGATWSRGASGAYLRATSSPATAETARLITDQRWVAAPDTYGTDTVLRRLVLEFEMKLTDVTYIDEEATFFGWTKTTADTRASDDIIGFYLDASADDLYSLTDNGSAETTNDTGIDAAGLASWHKYKIDIYAGNVKFYVDEALKTTHATNLPDYPMYLDFFIENDGGAGGLTIELGVIRLWTEDIAR